MPGIYMPPGIMLFLKWSMEKACEASCCAYGVWEKDVTFVICRTAIPRNSDLLTTTCYVPTGLPPP